MVCVCVAHSALPPFTSSEQESHRQFFERHHPHRARTGHVNSWAVRLHHLGVLPASLSPLSGSRLCAMACVWHLSHVCVRALGIPPPEGIGFGSLPSPRLGCVNGVNLCVPLGSPSLSSLPRRWLYDNALSGTVPTEVCNLIVTGDLDRCHLGGNHLKYPPPFCASKCNNTNITY